MATASNQLFTIALILSFVASRPSVAQERLDVRPHPRLLFTAEAEARVKALLPQDTVLVALVDVVRQYADAALDEPVVSYTFDEPNNPPNSRRLKAQRRAAMFRVLNLAVAYRLTSDVRYAERAKADLLAAAQFPNWWPPHFLNVGEFTALVALGYDWLYDELTEGERATIRAGILQNGLAPGLEAYGGADFGWWVGSDANWNQVCNAGLVLGALAVAEEAPDTAAAIVESALASIPKAMQSYEPDGAWEEGPTYWAYGTTYNALLLAALESALGNLQGLDEVAGYEELGRSGFFHVQTVGPTNLYFNFGDAKDVAYFSPVLFWMSRHYDEPVYAWFERELVVRDLERMRRGDLMKDETLDRFLALLVVWYNAAGQTRSYADLPYDDHFEGSAAVGAMRSGWTDDALYLGFKGGDNQAQHGHMDLGSFVLDAEGVRWALDLGGDDYSLPGYFNFSGPRWDYFRLSNRSHNTLVLGGGLQSSFAEASITAFDSTPEQVSAIVDLSGGYGQWARRVRRGYALLDRSRVLIQDEVEPLYAGFDVRWQMVTAAEIALDGATATLTQDGQTLHADILEPAGATFEVLSTDPGDVRQETNEGTQMLAVRLNASSYAEPVGLVVLLTPVNETTEGLPVPAFRPLSPSAVAVEEADVPERFALHGNYPNPFNPATALRFDLPSPAEVAVVVYDLLGRRVLSLPPRPMAVGAGRTLRLDMGTLASGTYLYRVTARAGTGTQILSGRMILMK